MAWMDGGTCRRVAGVVVAVSLLAAACADGGEGGPAADDDGEPSERVVVGLLNPLTGPFTALGEDVNDGFRLYLDQHDGQLAGYDVDVRVEDEANDASAATEAAQRLVERDGADFLVGFVNSGVAYAASTYIVETGVPLVITTAGADGLTQGDGAQNIFRVSYTSSQDAMPLGPYACEELGYQRVAVVGLDYAFGWEAAGGFSRTFEDAGCDVVQELYAPLGTQDWAPFVQQIDTSADAVWAVIAGPDAVRFLRSYRDFGVEVPLLGHGALTDEQVLEEQRATADGVVTTLHYSAAIDTPENRAFVDAFEDTYGRSVSQYAEHGYAAAMTIAAALEQATSLEHDELVGALAGVSVTAPRGPLTFDEHGQAVYNVYVREVRQQDDQWVNAVIDTIEDVSQFFTYGAEEYLQLPRYEELKATWAK